MVSRKPPPRTTTQRPPAFRAKTGSSTGRPPPPVKSRPPAVALRPQAVIKPSARPREESLSGVTRPDALAPADLHADEVTIPRGNPYALPTRQPLDSHPQRSKYGSQTGTEAETEPGVPRTGSRRRLESQTTVDAEPPAGVITERESEKLYDELYDAVNTEVTRTEVLFGLTQFARRRVEAYRKRQTTHPEGRARRLDGTSPSRARPLRKLLTAYVSVAGVPMRVWLFGAGLMALAAAATALAVLWSAPLAASRKVDVSPVPSSAPPEPEPAISALPGPRALDLESTSPPLPAPSATTLAERAADGDQAAAKQLRERALGELSSDEMVAIERAKVRQHLADLEALRAGLVKDPELINSQDWLDTLNAFISFEPTSFDALLVVAGLPGTNGPDILYEVWTRTSRRASTAELARQLLYAHNVRPKASPALAATLDLLEYEDRTDPADCEDLGSILERVQEYGDARALSALGALRGKRGCGESKQDDCYGCLRGQSDLSLARTTRAARARKPPQL